MAKKTYDHRAIEAAAQQKWESLALNEAHLGSAKDPYYLLVEFPYPSGDLHGGQRTSDGCRSRDTAIVGKRSKTQDEDFAAAACAP